MHGKMTKAAMPLWVEAGLIKPSDVVKNAGGSWQVKPGAVAGTTQFEANPFAWVQTVLRPGIQKLMDSRHISAETAINSMFSNRNAAFAEYNMYTKAQQYERDKKTIDQADSYSTYRKLMKTNPELAQLALRKQWQNLLGQLGFSIMPQLIKGMTALIGILQKMTAFTRAHPHATGLAVGGFAGASGLLVIGGTITMLAGAFRALGLVLRVFGIVPWIGIIVNAVRLLGLVLGAAVGAIIWPVVAIGVAVTAIGITLFQMWKHWNKTKGFFENIRSELGMFWSWLGGIANWIGGVASILRGNPLRRSGP